VRYQFDQIQCVLQVTSIT